MRKLFFHAIHSTMCQADAPCEGAQMRPIPFKSLLNVALFVYLFSLQPVVYENPGTSYETIRVNVQ